MTDVSQLGAHSGLKRIFRDNTDGTYAEEQSSQLRAWDPTSLSYVKVIVDHASGALSTSSSGGGGGAATIADGADVAQGTTTDLSSANTVVGLLKAIKAAITGSLTISGSTGRTWTLASGTDSVATTDGGGSITIDAPVATPVWVRLSDGAAAFIGQKAMAASIPVVIASDQSSLPTTEARLPTALVGGRLDVNIGAAGAAVAVTDNSGSLTIDSADLGVTTDVEASGNGSLIAIAKRLRTLLNGGLPAALAANGGLKVEGIAGGVAQPVSLATNTPDVTDRAARLLGHVTVDNATLAVTQSGTFTSAQGTAAALAGAWPVRVTDLTNSMPTMDAVARKGFQAITDGTNTAAVKAASTPPAATDPALVVDLRRTPSEGSALASGSHAVGTFTFDIADTTGFTGIAIVTDLTVLGVSSTVTNTIQVKDPVTAKFATATAAAFTVVNSVSTTRQAMHPANAGASGNLQGGVLTKAVRVSSVVAVAASTYSIGYSLTP